MNPHTRIMVVAIGKSRSRASYRGSLNLVDSPLHPPTFPTFLRLLYLAVSLALIPFFVACSESTSPTDVYVGRLEGIVEDASGPVVGTEVTAERFEFDDEYVKARTDSLGQFRLQLLPGRWIVHVNRKYYDRGRLRPHKAQAEVLSVTEQEAVPAIRARYGGVEVALSAPQFEGETVFLSLETPIFGNQVEYGSAVVENGVAEFTFPRVPVTDVRGYVYLDEAYCEIDFELAGSAVEVATVSPGSMSRYSARLRPATDFTININRFSVADPVYPVELEVRRFDDNRPIRSIPLQDNGPLHFRLFETAPFRISTYFRHPTLGEPIPVDRYLTSYNELEEPVITYQPGSETTLPSFDACALEVRLQAEIQSENFCWLQIHSADGDDLLARTQVASTAEDREFHPRLFTGLIPGEVTLAFVTNQDHLISHWYSPSGPVFEPEPFQLGEAGTKTVIDWPLFEAARIQGTVVDESGTPLNDIFFSATGIDNNYVNRNLGRSDEDGKFDVGPFPPGTYTLGGFRYPGISRWYPGVESEDEASTFQLDWGSSQDSLVFVFR